MNIAIEKLTHLDADTDPADTNIALPPFVETSTGALVTIVGADILREESWNNAAIKFVIKTPMTIDDGGEARECTSNDCHQVISAFANSVNEQLHPDDRPLCRLVGVADPTPNGWHISVICDPPTFVSLNDLMALPTLRPSFKKTCVIGPALGFIEAYLELSRVNCPVADAVPVS